MTQAMRRETREGERKHFAHTVWIAPSSPEVSLDSDQSEPPRTKLLGASSSRLRQSECVLIQCHFERTCIGRGGRDKGGKWKRKLRGERGFI